MPESPARKPTLSPSMHTPEAEKEPTPVEELSLDSAITPNKPDKPDRPDKPQKPEKKEESTAPPSTSYRSSPSKPAPPPPGPSTPSTVPPTRAGVGAMLPPAKVRALLSADPELLEAGLEVHTDGAGQAIGKSFETDVGTIDLLARDAEGQWVVVHVVEGQPDSGTMPGLLKRMGWVRKHLIKDGEGLRSIVVLEKMDEELGYAAAAVGGSVEFRTCQVSITFERVEV